MRRATPDDVPRLARLFTAVFATDPVFDWLTRDGRSRHDALERFFLRILKSRTLPHGETWLTANGLAAAAWIPPYSPLQSPSLLDDLRMFPTILRLTGLPRLAARRRDGGRDGGRASASSRASISPSSAWRRACKGAGLGSLLLERTLARVDAARARRLSREFQSAQSQAL